MNQTKPAANAAPLVSVKLKADNHRIDNLEVMEVYDGDRDKSMFPKDLKFDVMGVLKETGGVLFKTQKGKNLFMHFEEFSFLFPKPA